MKILFINTSLFGTDGISRVLSCLSSELAKTHNVTVVTFEKEKEVDKDRYGLSPSVHVLFKEAIYRKCKFRRLVHKINQKTGILPYLGKKALYDWTYVPKHLQDAWVDFINKNGFDVVCGVQGKGAYILGSCVERLTCKTIGWQHNSYEAYLENKGAYYWNQDFLFERYIRKLDYYVVLNEHDERMYLEKKGLKTVTIYNPKSFVSQQKSNVQKHRFIACGGLRKAKGFDMLIEAFKIFARDNTDWTLDIFGDGDDRQTLSSKIIREGLSGRIALRGETTRIGEEMVTSSALLLSSRWEGMPMVVLEALECGLPVVAFDITAIRPLVTNDVEGLIVPAFDVVMFAEAMKRIAENEALRKDFGKAAVTKASKFDVECIAKQWEKLFVG